MNLFGTYFGRAKVGGKLIRQSPHTSTYSVAVLRFNDLLKDNRGPVETREATRSGPMTFREAADQLLRQIDSDPSVKPATRDYRCRCLEAPLRSWPDLAATDVRRITPDNARIGPPGSPSATARQCTTNTVGFLRKVLVVAVKSGVRFGNPAADVQQVKVPRKQLRLPSTEQFQRMVRTIAERGGRFGRECANLVELLAYGGFRNGESASIRWADCDFAKGRIFVGGDPKHGAKTGESRWVPMNAAMSSLLRRLRSERPDDSPMAAVMKILDCQKTMERACRELGLDRMTHRDLRHFFAARCIEAGIDIPTVSRWLGHKDGCALAMHVYGHLRDQHSQARAQRVSFDAPAFHSDHARSAETRQP